MNRNNNENNHDLLPIFYINREDVQSLPKEYILVADDSTICRRMICKVLERFGFETEGMYLLSKNYTPFKICFFLFITPKTR